MAELEPNTEATTGNETQGAYISERLRNPDAFNPATVKPAGNYLFAGICAILTTVVYIAILLLLYFDWEALKIA